MLSTMRPLKYGDKQGITEKENIKYICVTTGDSVIYNYHLNIPLCSLCVVYEVKVLGALNTTYSPTADQIICAYAVRSSISWLKFIFPMICL